MKKAMFERTLYEKEQMMMDVKRKITKETSGMIYGP